MTDYPTYTVTVTREGTEWVAVVSDGLPQGVAGGLEFEHFADIATGMRELVADLVDLDTHEFNIGYRFELGGKDVTDFVRPVIDAEEDYRRFKRDRDHARRVAIDGLNGLLSQRALADMVGLSHQRINQIANHRAC